MSENSSNNKRIAKNSILLYIRLAIVMVGSLYISRVILDSLGISDYGLYNVVGGFVTIFTVVTSSLAAATSRFITFELGRNDIERLKTVFSLSVSIHIVLSFLIFIALETFGVWYLNNCMVISPDRLDAANLVLHFSVITLIFTLLNVPYNAALMAHEHMDFFAYASILEVLLKLVVSFVLPYLPYDPLIAYAFLIMTISLLMRILYTVYCKYRFDECTYRIRKDNLLLREMLVFSGWNFIGATSGILKRQGNNLVVNLFFGTVVNAAYGLTMQMTSAISSFSTGFLNAINPQIIKHYSTKDMEYMLKLIFGGSRASFYLMMLICVPLFLNTESILNLWLKEVPEYTVVFLKLSILYCLVETWSGPLMTAMLATGNIKKYQIVVGGTDIMCLPLSYACLRLGMPVFAVFVVMLLISCITLFLRIKMLQQMIGLPGRRFVVQIVGKSAIICTLSMLVSYFTCDSIHLVNGALIGIIINVLISITVVFLLIICFDTTQTERSFIVSFVNKMFKK